MVNYIIKCKWSSCLQFMLDSQQAGSDDFRVPGTNLAKGKLSPEAHQLATLNPGPNTFSQVYDQLGKWTPTRSTLLILEVIPMKLLNWKQVSLQKILESRSFVCLPY